MGQTKQKSKGGKKPSTLYSGALGQRSNDLPPNPPVHTVLGDASESQKRKHEKECNAWVLRQAERALEGIPLLFEHYGIEQSRENDLLLVLAMARDHVPYFMEPVRPRGRPPSKAQVLVPAISDIATQAAKQGISQSHIFELATKMFGPEYLKDSLVREVKRFRSTKKNKN